MVIDQVLKLYRNLRLHNYQKFFGKIREKDGSLSATEAFSADVIYILGEPTIKQFSDFLGISQPNASYKVSSLMNKGYISKEASEDDRREYHLRVSERFYHYYEENLTVFRDAVKALEEKHDEKELELFGEMLREINELL